MIISSISNKNIKPSEAIKASDIRESLLSFIQKNHPEFSSEGYLSYEELNFFRRLYITELVIQELGLYHFFFPFPIRLDSFKCTASWGSPI